MAGQSSNTKSLIVFDFDETIIDGTSIFDIMHLYPRAYYADTQNIDMTHGWNEKNTAMFASLKSHGIDIAALKKVVLDIPLVNGMEELLGYLQSSEHDAILISGANTLFIDWYLEDRKLQGVFQGVYTNFANIKDGKLVLRCFHHQDNCKRCVRSICKGQVLEEVVAKKKAEGTKYSKICYIGDGDNDLCPVLRLSKEDYVFPRAGYALEYRISKARQIAAQIVPWECASTITKTIKELSTR